MFGVVVVDVANKNTPITGAQVTLTSRYAAGKQLTATTDDEGTAIFEVAPLSEGTWTRRRFSTRTTSTAASPLAWRLPRCRDSPRACPRRHRHYRTHTSALRWRAVLSPAHIREWDIQYADATFMAMQRTKQQTISPTRTLFTVQAHLPQSGQATLHINKVMPAAGSSSETVTQIGQVTASASGADNLATFTLEDKFLDAASSLLEEGCKLRFVLDYQQTYTLLSPWPLYRAAARRNPDRPLSSPPPWTKRSLRLISPQRFPASAAISSRAGCPHFRFSSILVCWIRAVWRRIQTSQLYERFGQP